MGDSQTHTTTPVSRGYDLPAFQTRLAHILAAAHTLKSEHLGVFVAEIQSGRFLYTHNPDLPLVPASNMKTLLCATALIRLGASFQYTTTVLGAPTDPLTGVMTGPLVLRSNGDPTFMKPFSTPPEAVLEQFARALANAGLRRLSGPLVVDDSAFDRQYVGPGWKTKWLLEDYAAPCGAVSLNANTVQITVAPFKTTPQPSAESLRISNTSTVTAHRTRLVISRRLGTEEIRIRGRIAKTAHVTNTLTVNDPGLFTGTAFAHLLKTSGIAVDGPVRLVAEDDRPALDTLAPLAIYRSPPLLQILQYMHKESDNFVANQVMKTLGHELLGQGSFQGGTAVIRDTLQQLGIQDTGLVMVDGCGLSEEDRVTTRILGSLLLAMARRPEVEDFYSTFPQAGVDGTLHHRLPGVLFWAKTGTLDDASALSGFVQTRAGQTLVFSIIVNHPVGGTAHAKALENALMKQISAWPEKL